MCGVARVQAPRRKEKESPLAVVLGSFGRNEPSLANKVNVRSDRKTVVRGQRCRKRWAFGYTYVHIRFGIENLS